MSLQDDDVYVSMSVATLGSSTIAEGPKSRYVHAPSKIFNEDKERPKTYYNKPCFFGTGDIEGAQPKRAHQRKVPGDNLRVSDIDGATVLIKDKFLHTKRHEDPLQPNYKLPSCKLAPPPEPKFVKDSMNVDDIDGTRSSVKTVYQGRDTLNISDIEGSSAGWKPRQQKLEERDIMATQYAKKVKFQDRTNRVSNSMKPTYCLNGIEIKDSPRSEPRKQKAFISDGHQLQTADIEGAQAGYITKHQLSIPLDQRREFRNTNYIADIQGSSADSVKHSIVTKREMHPLQPVYQSLDGGGEMLEGPIQPLIPKDCVKFDASSFKTSGVIREIGVDGHLLHPQPSSTLSSNTQLDIITHRSINTFASNRSKQNTPKQSPLGSARSSSRQMSSNGNVNSHGPASNGGGGLMETGESFSGMGSGNTKSMNFFDTSDFGESKSYAEKFSDSDFIVPKLETSGSRGGGGGYESKLSTGRSSGHVTPQGPSQASSRKSSRSSVISRRAQAELEAEVNAIRGL